MISTTVQTGAGPKPVCGMAASIILQTLALICCIVAAAGAIVQNDTSLATITYKMFKSTSGSVTVNTADIPMCSSESSDSDSGSTPSSWKSTVQGLQAFTILSVLAIAASIGMVAAGFVASHPNLQLGAKIASGIALLTSVVASGLMVPFCFRSFCGAYLAEDSSLEIAFFAPGGAVFWLLIAQCVHCCCLKTAATTTTVISSGGPVAEYGNYKQVA